MNKLIASFAVIVAMVATPVATFAQQAQTQPQTQPQTKTPATPKAEKQALGAGEYASEAEAKARCVGDVVVWNNKNTKVYHYAGYAEFGKTKKGAYMCEKAAIAAKSRAAKNEKRPG